MTRSSLSITRGSSRSYSQSKFRTWGGSAIKSLYQNDLSTIGVELFDNVDAVLAGALDVSPIAAQMQAKVKDMLANAGKAQDAADAELDAEAGE